MKEHFRKVFTNVDEQRKLRTELTKLTSHGNDDYADYVKKFMAIRIRLSEYPENELLHAFVNGSAFKAREK